ncbi:hypothetical protein BX666DRAFT_2002754, partial [Dichotomocladium elegans]
PRSNSLFKPETNCIHMSQPKTQTERMPSKSFSHPPYFRNVYVSIVSVNSLPVVACENLEETPDASLS